jgi:hypothetical protein
MVDEPLFRQAGVTSEPFSSYLLSVQILFAEVSDGRFSSGRSGPTQGSLRSLAENPYRKGDENISLL